MRKHEFYQGAKVERVNPFSSTKPPLRGVIVTDAYHLNNVWRCGVRFGGSEVITEVALNRINLLEGDREQRIG